MSNRRTTRENASPRARRTLDRDSLPRPHRVSLVHLAKRAFACGRTKLSTCVNYRRVSPHGPIRSCLTNSSAGSALRLYSPLLPVRSLRMLCAPPLPSDPPEPPERDDNVERWVKRDEGEGSAGCWNEERDGEA